VMQNVPNKTSPIRSPACPRCHKLMTLKTDEPDLRYVNLHHMIFKCDDCGWDSDQIVADLQ